MHTLKLSEIAKQYGVSSSTVHGWLQDGINGKNNLEVKDNKILNNTRNEEELVRLYELGRSHVKNEFKQEIIASPEFLDLFDIDQLIEFISDLENKQINEKFTYLDYEGADNWNAIYESEASNLQSNSYFLLKNLFRWIQPYLLNSNKYNVFDVGPGNGIPILDFLNPLNTENKLEKYYAIDISTTINKLVEQNMNQYLPNIFGDSLIADIENDRFNGYLYEKIQNNVSNIIFFIGGTISNILDRVRVFKNIQSGMTPNDFLIFTFSLNTPENRRGVAYVLNEESDRHQNWLPEFLGIEIDSKNNRADYNAEGNYKYKTFRVEKDYTITFPLFNQDKTVFLSKGTEITTWRHYLIAPNIVEQELNKAGLDIVALQKDPTGQTGMIICKIKS